MFCFRLTELWTGLFLAIMSFVAAGLPAVLGAAQGVPPLAPFCGFTGTDIPTGRNQPNQDTTIIPRFILAVARFFRIALLAPPAMRDFSASGIRPHHRAAL